MAKANQTVVVRPSDANAQEETKQWQDFNSASFAGRVAHVSINETGPYGKYAKITVITRLSDGTDGVSLVFNDNGDGLTLTERGYLPVGRRVIITGHIKEFATTYTDPDGLIVPLARPRMQMTKVNIDLGALPRKEDA